MIVFQRYLPFYLPFACERNLLERMQLCSTVHKEKSVRHRTFPTLLDDRIGTFHLDARTDKPEALQAVSSLKNQVLKKSPLF